MFRLPRLHLNLLYSRVLRKRNLRLLLKFVFFLQYLPVLVVQDFLKQDLNLKCSQKDWVDLNKQIYVEELHCASCWRWTDINLDIDRSIFLSIHLYSSIWHCILGKCDDLPNILQEISIVTRAVFKCYLQACDNTEHRPKHFQASWKQSSKILIECRRLLWNHFCNTFVLFCFLLFLLVKDGSQYTALT